MKDTLKKRHIAIRNGLARRLGTLFMAMLMSVTGLAQKNAMKDISESEAMAFLYQNMPLPDRINHDEDFFRMQVDVALRARQEMPWGKSIPTREWMHFVLPIRVNNEDMDMFRVEKYDELKSRVGGMTMEEAALEVNHWCHEHVSYQPSDMRTSGPSSTIRSAIGRCGEESTLTVAALRTVGIPARQVYTPRWAHTDDNHAWVEVWIDGNWKFMGACEPEPVLNLGWFNAPASRAMLMHTKAFGHYDGPERVMTETACYTEIDVTDTYAPTSVFKVQVVDTKGKPVRGATVQFRLYNYAEFYPLHTKKTDKKGLCDFKAGHGSLLVWATDGNRFGFEKIQVGSTDMLRIELKYSKNNLPDGAVDIDVTPPAERNTIPAMTDEQVARNKQRLAYEDSVRDAYIATFSSQQDGTPASQYLHLSRGNHRTIADFLHNASNKARALKLLSLLSEKDLRDVDIRVLDDCYKLAPDTLPYILNPRISNELLTPYRNEFLRLIPQADKIAFHNNPRLLAERIQRDFIIDEEHNPQQLCMHPVKAWQTKRCDRHSRDIMFVAMCRTLGVEARIDEVTGKVQYRKKQTALKIYDQGQMSHTCDIVTIQDDKRPWQTVFEEKKAKTAQQQHKFRLQYSADGLLPDPHYNNHFTLSKLVDGLPVLLNYPECESISKIFGQPTYEETGKLFLTPFVNLDDGEYMLTTGTRLANGGVLASIVFFTIGSGETTVALHFRTSTDEVQVIGGFGSETRYTPVVTYANEGVSLAGTTPTNFISADELPETSILSTTGRGYYVIGLLNVGTEPTNHALNDLSTMKEQLEAWGRPILLIVNDADEAARIQHDFPNLPATVHFGLDSTGKIREGMQTAVQGEPVQNLPVFLVADTFDRVVFIRQGYTIGLGDQIIKVVKNL